MPEPEAQVTRALGSLEGEIMAILWELPQANVRDVTGWLNVRRAERPLAYTTVMTVMSRLAEKGLLERRLVGKTYEYRAACSQAEFLVRLSQRRVKAVLEEFGELALAQFLGHLGELDPESLQRLIDLAHQQRREEAH